MAAGFGANFDGAHPYHHGVVMEVDWELLRGRVCAATGLYEPAVADCCAVCRGPVTAGYRRCYQCEGHLVDGAGLLSDLVVPICYAVQGTPFGRELWQYKAVQVPGGTLLPLLLTYLHDHAACLWRGGLSPRIIAPDRLAIVPSGRGRPGVHPLVRMVAPYLTLPLVALKLNPGEQGRDLNPDRFSVEELPAGASVFLLDDTWVSGGSVQSAAAALKLAGASQVVTLVLARLLQAADPRAMTLASKRYDPLTCAVHTR